MAYFERAAADGVVHAELFFDPQTHTARGLAYETVLDGLERACVTARERFGIGSRLILCFLRHLSEEEGFATLEQALPHLARIHGVGLDSSEMGHPHRSLRGSSPVAANLACTWLPMPARARPTTSSRRWICCRWNASITVCGRPKVRR